MKIEFIIYSHFFKERGMKVKGDWNFPHLPRIGEEISPHIIMFQNEFRKTVPAHRPESP